ncbi:MAG TPA: hypothetical protein VGM30_12865 [Puia sp.]|jgi:hypothetical protein
MIILIRKNRKKIARGFATLLAMAFLSYRGKGFQLNVARKETLTKQ